MPPLTPGRRAAVTVSLSLAVFMNVLDLSIANVAIPTIAGDLGVSADNGTWLITSFAVCAAIAMPLSGWFGRRFGELRTFIFCTAAFTVASLLCGLAVDLPMLIAMRAVQGLVSGPMIPLSQSLLLANYPDERKNVALSLLLMVTIAAPVLGPILGGWITDNWSWEWVFFINVPIGIVASLSTAFLLRGRETKTEKIPIDKIGIGLLALGLGSLQVLLDRGKDLDWFGSSTIITLAAIALIALVLFVAWELTDEHPAVDLRLFARRNFTVGAVALCLGYGVYFGNIVLLPLWLQMQLGYTATWAGLATAPVGILPILLSPFVGRYMGSIDLRWWATASFVSFGLAAFLFSGLNTQVTFGQIAWSRMAQGLGLACFFPPLIAVVISGLPANRIASATGLANTLRTLAGSFATSLTTTAWDRREALHQARLSESVTVFDPAARAAVDQFQVLGMPGDTAIATIERSIVQQAYMLATNELFWCWAWILLALVALVWLARPPFGGSSRTLATE
ncbi:MAG: DHA2 family efflux MFS transporter permease subunit [Pseudomonadota bacterium]